MPTNWAEKVRDAITNLETKGDRVLEPDQALAIIDDVVDGKFAAAELATIHGIPPEWIRAVSDRRESALGDLDSQDVSNGRVSLMHRFAGTACLALILLIYESV